MPLILEPANDDLKRVIPGMLLYRGSSNKEELRKKISPKYPLPINIDSPSEIVDLIFKEQKPQKHILELEKSGHFVSFSLKKKVAYYYATSHYTKPGYIVIVKFPKISGPPVTIGGAGPYIFECNDRTVWLDLRHLPTMWIRAASRTKVDQELLLLGGGISSSKPLPVKPEACDQSFFPWSIWEKNCRISENE